MAQARNSQRIRVASGLALTLVASAVIWSKLRLVGDVPRRAFAEPDAVMPLPAPETEADFQTEPTDPHAAPRSEADGLS